MPKKGRLKETYVGHLWRIKGGDTVAGGGEKTFVGEEKGLRYTQYETRKTSQEGGVAPSTVHKPGSRNVVGGPPKRRR